MQRFSGIFRKKQNVCVHDAEQNSTLAKTNGTLIRKCLDVLRSNASVVDGRLAYDRLVRGMGVSDAEAKVTLGYLSKKGILWQSGDYVGMNSGLFRCEACLNLVEAKPHQMKSCRANGRSLQVSRADEGRFCGCWCPKGLGAELVDGWSES